MGRKAINTLKDCKKWACNKQGQCLSIAYSCYKMSWQCSKKHIWVAPPHRVKLGAWCPQCSGNARLTIAKIKQLAERNGGKCLSKKCINSKSLLSFKCQDGHTWWTTAGSISNGRWCPTCVSSIGEEKCRFILESLTNHKFIRTRKALGNGWELDGFCKKINLAFEYQGIQHYKRVKKWQTSKQFCELQQRDKDKTKLCKQNGIKKINITYEISDNSQLVELIKEWLTRINIPILGSVDWKNFSFLPQKLEEIRNMANKRNFDCLSCAYLIKMKFQCRKCSYIWETRIDHFKDGHGCPRCGGRPSYSINDMHNFAKLKNGFCRSNTYINETTKLTWECEFGHRWSSTPHTIKSCKWCPECGKKKSWETRRLNAIKKQVEQNELAH